MSGGSPSVDRAIALLNFFISHPRESFTVAQIVRALKLNRATCHAIVTSLTQAGYLFRGSDKRYVLGPAILTIVRQARLAFSEVDIARLESRQLAERLDAIVSVQKLEDDMVASCARSVSARHLSLDFPEAMRHPIHPWGVPFLTMASDSELETSFARASPPLSEKERAFEREMIAFTREYGFIFAVQPSDEVREQMFRSGVWHTGDFVTQLDPEAQYDLLFFLSPVIDQQQGTVPFELAVSGIEGIRSGSEILEIGKVIVETSRRIATFMAN